MRSLNGIDHYRLSAFYKSICWLTILFKLSGCPVTLSLLDAPCDMMASYWVALDYQYTLAITFACPTSWTDTRFYD